MAAWFIPALKAILPHVGTIVGAAAPVFTRKGTEKEADPLVLVGKQIAELQAAAAKHTRHQEPCCTTARSCHDA